MPGWIQAAMQQSTIVISLLVQQWFNFNNAEGCQCDVLLGEECTCHTHFGNKNCQDMKEMEIHPITIRELIHPGEILQTKTQPSSLPVKLVEVRNNNGEVITFKCRLKPPESYLGTFY